MKLRGPFLRGTVYAAKVEHIDTEKYFLVVSNNVRNRQLATALVVRLTTSPKPALASIVELGPGDPLRGRVLCDDILELWPDEVRKDRGTLTPETMGRVDVGLKSALGLS